MVFPKILFDYYHELKLDNQEFIFLIYLLNSSVKLNPTIMSKDLNLSIPDFMRVMDNLIGKDCIKIELMSEGNKKEEWISLEPLYKKLALKLTQEEEIKTDLYSEFEQEFARTLSPMEYELINGWLQNGSTEETIRLALKEAVFNGAHNLKYIDRILYDWGKKGIKTKEDVQKDREKWNKGTPKKDLFDYDWLNENDD